MSETITLSPYDEVFFRVDAERAILLEIQERFCYFADGYKYQQKYKMGWWDGKIRLFSLTNRLLYRGLLLDLVAFAKERQYPITITNPQLYEALKPTDVTEEQVQQFVDSLDLPYTPHDFQFNALKSIIKQRRRTIKSATGSGKSMIVYMATRYFDLKNMNVLIVVPTIGLVNQLWANFEEFSHGTWDVASKGHKIYGGQEKDSEKQFTISTWQSLQGMPREFYAKFDACIIDECHGAKAKVLKEVLENCFNADHRIGLTGTLDGFLANEMLIKGLLGPIIEVSNTRDLIDRGLLADLFIHCVVLKYPVHIREATKRLDYQQEVDYVISYEPRNKLLCNMADRLTRKYADACQSHRAWPVHVQFLTKQESEKALLHPSEKWILSSVSVSALRLRSLTTP